MKGSDFMLNEVFLQGRLTAIPELMHTKTDKAVVHFSIAVEDNRSVNDEREVNFFNCEAWHKTAEFICKYFEKGQQIIIDGRLKTSTFTDKDGNNRKNVYVVVEGVNFCGAKSAKAQEKDIEEVFENYEPDDLPFE